MNLAGTIAIVLMLQKLSPITWPRLMNAATDERRDQLTVVTHRNWLYQYTYNSPSASLAFVNPSDSDCSQTSVTVNLISVLSHYHGQS